jgi:hypothetical protein
LQYPPSPLPDPSLVAGDIFENSRIPLPLPKTFKILVFLPTGRQKKSDFLCYGSLWRRYYSLL